MTWQNNDKILYHDRMIATDSSPDGMLTDNWNPDGDYGEDEYVDVHFRIETPSYRPPAYYFEEADRQRFNAELTEVFTRLGWTLETGEIYGACTTVVKGKSNLYLHPQDFSGEVLKSEVKAIAEALRGHESFSLRWVDLYETIYDITDDAYYAYLDTQAERIREEILKASVTTRRNKYFREYDIANHVAAKVRLNRIGDDDGKHVGVGKTACYIIDVIDQLVEGGELATALSGKGFRMIRSLSKTEQRARKKQVKAA